MKISTKRLAELSLMTAIALIIFVIELQIPNLSPIAGVKLGLANIITVYGVYRFKGWEIALILLVRIILGGLFCGSPSTVLYSLSGGVLCLLGMLPLKRIIPRSRLWICSVLGAVLHNVGQIAAAVILMRTAAVIAYLPFLLVSGCIAGAFTGICGQLLLNRLDKRNPKGRNRNERQK